MERPWLYSNSKNAFFLPECRLRSISPICFQPYSIRRCLDCIIVAQRFHRLCSGNMGIFDHRFPDFFCSFRRIKKSVCRSTARRHFRYQQLYHHRPKITRPQQSSLRALHYYFHYTHGIVVCVLAAQKTTTIFVDRVCYLHRTDACFHSGWGRRPLPAGCCSGLHDGLSFRPCRHLHQSKISSLVMDKQQALLSCISVVAACMCGDNYRQNNACAFADLLYHAGGHLFFTL